MGLMRTLTCLALILLRSCVTADATTHKRLGWKDFSRPEGSVGAVYDLIDRVLKDPTLKHAFQLRIEEDDNPWFRLEVVRQNSMNGSNKTATDSAIIAITATSASELTAGLGYYFKEYCNFTLEWSTGGRAGGSHIVIPDVWPVPLQDSKETVSVALQKKRVVPWSYLMNVCTHSYSLVWYDWTAWQSLIDNLALRGINMILALTGQEEIQYQVFSELGVPDEEIRSWFNGPAFLTWSRGQNEYGNAIAGPLPRSFMKSQWHLQREHILPRLRSLGIVGILPAFQGNVPIQIKTLFNDSNITQQGDTGWLDSLDPLFGRIADLWMERLIQDFGTDHYYQLDGYFNGGTAPWMQENETQRTDLRDDTKTFTRKRRVASSNAVPSEERSHNDDWYRRGLAAYNGVSGTDSQAHWVFQGFAFVGWDTDEQASYLKGFIDSAPEGKFIIIDMGYAEEGQWRMWNNASLFDAPFLWTKLYNFGDTDGMRGDLSHLNKDFPNQALEAGSSIVGIGSTPEGIDHNPIYFELLFEQGFRDSPIPDLLGYLSTLAHKRYGLTATNTDVKSAWQYLLESSYSKGFSVQDQTGVAHLNPQESTSLFKTDRKTPQPIMCNMFQAWRHLIAVGQATTCSTEPYIYDLVNTGREVLARLSTPMALNFSDAHSQNTMDRMKLLRTGKSYVELLEDLDLLLEQSKAFRLDPWIESARLLAESDAAGGVQKDCFSSILSNTCGCCRKFYEWNARCQVTTWNPTPMDAAKVPGGPIDYAAKHWSGLVKPYYAKRAKILLDQALEDEENQQELNQTEVQRLFAKHAFEWTTGTSQTLAEQSRTREDPVAIANSMLEKYSKWFSTCSEEPVSEKQ